MPASKVFQAAVRYCANSLNGWTGSVKMLSGPVWEIFRLLLFVNGGSEAPRRRQQLSGARVLAFLRTSLLAEYASRQF